MSVLDVGFHIKPPTSQEFPIYETMSSLRYDSRGNRFSVHTESKDIIFPAGSVGPRHGSLGEWGFVSCSRGLIFDEFHSCSLKPKAML
jgi:hypothetical protein